MIFTLLFTGKIKKLICKFPTMNRHKHIYTLHFIFFVLLLSTNLAAQEQNGKSTGGHFSKRDGVLYLSSNGKDLLGFQYATHYPPQGIDTFYKRSGYIHPLYTPHGQLLTWINAPDHYHHYGIWNPWTKILYRGKEYDLWNLADRKGTVSFEDFTSVKNNKKTAAFTARLDHIINTGTKENFIEKIIMKENQTIVFYTPGKNKDHYFLDMTIELVPVTDSPIILKEYRYGGLGWRATSEWDKNNSTVLTSQDLPRSKADGSLAKWVLAEGKLGNERGGMIWFSHPDNFNHPEPLRVWPEDTNGGRGDLFINFSPTKNKDWKLEPGKKYVLKYRMLIYNGSPLQSETIEKLWQQFSTNTIKVDF